MAAVVGRRIDRRIWVLPLIALATAVAVLVPAEIVLRKQFPNQEVDRCIGRIGSMPHGRRNCVADVKAAEGPWVRNRYNECGYRSVASCGPLKDGERRIAMIGSSMGASFFVPEPESITGRMSAMLRVACRQPVQTQNLALPAFPIDKMATSAAEGLSLDPDVLIVTVTSNDLRVPSHVNPQYRKPLYRSVIDMAESAYKSSTILYMAKQQYLSSETEYQSFVTAENRTNKELAEETATGLAVLDGQLQKVAKEASDKNVKVVLAFLPSRDEIVRVRLYAHHREPLDMELDRISRKYGFTYFNGISAIPGDIPTATIFYVANRHMNGLGDRYIASGLSSRLVNSVPAFTKCV